MRACLVWVPGFHSFPKCTKYHCFCLLKSTKKVHLENQINHAGNTLSKIMTDSHKIYTLSSGTSTYGPYTAVREYTPCVHFLKSWKQPMFTYFLCAIIFPLLVVENMKLSILQKADLWWQNEMPNKATTNTACKESRVRQPGASEFCYRASVFCS